MALTSTIKAFKQHLGNKESYLDKHHKNIADNIELHWGYPEFYDYMSALLVVEKDRNRSGLPAEVIDEIHILERIHEKQYPDLRAKSASKYLANL